MAMGNSADLFDLAAKTLKDNDRYGYTVPAGDLYPHQWLWDSCFIAIGLRHLDVERAQAEIMSLLQGQWSNGMLPNIIFNDAPTYKRDRNAWRSWLSPFAPDGLATSGITQPPMLAEAIVQVGAKLEMPERRSWYKKVWPMLLAYHEWLYQERDPHAEGLVLQIHPWEVGLDNTPPWMSELHEHLLPLWIRLIQKGRLLWIVNLLRRDTRSVPIDERFDSVEILAMFSVQQRLRRKAYDIDKILNHSLFTIEDLTFNSIFVRANEHLLAIAKTIREDVPDELEKRIELTRKAFEQLWDPYAQQYFSRDFITHKLIKVPSIAALMPLYAGCVSKERAAEIIKLLEDENKFGTAFPVPSAPADSPMFDAKRYWQGPAWVNTNWLIIDGLERYGFHDHAAALRESTLEMVETGGMYEYFNPISGAPLGAKNFSWTAALTIDLLQK